MTAKRTVARARVLVGEAAALYSDDAAHVAAAQRLEECRRRLDGPLRVALVGTVKAGKSTLLNALVGEEIAPTDATESTRVVTWFRHGSSPVVTVARRAGGGVSVREEVPIRRRRGRLELDLGDLGAADIDHLEVQWPARMLELSTLVDTPGTSSLSKDVSARTTALLIPPDEAPGVDAVLYLMRRLHDSDVRFLHQLQDAAGADGAPGRGGIGVVGVLSRADEIGAGRLDAMSSAKDVARRLTTAPELTGLCHTVLPVAGLLALGARTLRQSEFSAFRTLAAVPREELQLALLSADRFARPEAALPVDEAMRVQLAHRFGLFGIRMAVAMVRSGIADSPALAAELTRRSGLDQLRHVLGVQFGDRSDQLKVHSALLNVRAVLARTPVPGQADVVAKVDTMLADTHGFVELRLLGRLPALRLGLPDAEVAELHQVLGGAGVGVAQRLGVDQDSSPELMRARAVASARGWRARAARPLADPTTVRACRAAQRSAEGVLFELPTGEPPPGGGYEQQG